MRYRDPRKKLGGDNIFFEEEEFSRQKHRKCSLIYDNGTQMVNLHEIMARLLEMKLRQKNKNRMRKKSGRPVGDQKRVNFG